MTVSNDVVLFLGLSEILVPPANKEHPVENVNLFLAAFHALVTRASAKQVQISRNDIEASRPLSTNNFRVLDYPNRLALDGRDSVKTQRSVMKFP